MLAGDRFINEVNKHQGAKQRLMNTDLTKVFEKMQRTDEQLKQMKIEEVLKIRNYRLSRARKQVSKEKNKEMKEQKRQGNSGNFDSSTNRS